MTCEFAVSAEVATRSMRQLTKIGELEISKTKIDIAAGILHETTHFTTICSHTSGVFLYFLEHAIFGMKTEILQRYGSKYYADEINCRHQMEDIREPEIFAHYKMLDIAQSSRDLLNNFGRYPINKIREYNTLIGQDCETVHFFDDDFLTKVRLPSEVSFDLTRNAPSFEHILEGVAVLHEKNFMEYVTKNMKQPFRKNRYIKDMYSENYLYNNAIRFVLEMTKCNSASVLPAIIFSLALSPPCIGQEKTSWEEFHPSCRLFHLSKAAGELADNHRNASYNIDTLAKLINEIDEITANKLGWRTAAKNTDVALNQMKRVVLIRDINPIPSRRIYIFLQEKCKNAAFPYLISNPNFNTRAPVEVYTDGIEIFSTFPNEKYLLLSYLRIVTIQFAVKYLISRSQTGIQDEESARRIHRLVHKKLSQEKITNLDFEFPENYENFLSQWLFCPAHRQHWKD